MRVAAASGAVTVVSEQEPFDLGQEDLRERRDGSGSVGQKTPQPLPRPVRWFSRIVWGARLAYEP
jgi:hypothetical protein